MELVELSRPFSKAQATNSTQSGGFASIVPTVTEPSGAGVLNVSASGGGDVPKNAFFSLFGEGNADDGFSFRVIGWRHIGANDSVLWLPVILCDGSALLSTVTGVDGAPVSASERFSDNFSATPPAITFPGGLYYANIYYSNDSNLVAWCRLPLYGFEKLQFIFNLDSNATSANALVAFV